jgi:hypothetical protein
MMKHFRAAALAATLAVAAGSALAAQTTHSHLGVHALYNSTFDDFGVGAQFSAPIARHLEFYPSFDWYFDVPHATVWEANADVKYRALGERSEWFYVGTGLNIHRQTVDNFDLTRGGWNLFMGAESIRGHIHPFAEARATVTDHTRFQIQAGINITLGHGDE